VATVKRVEGRDDCDNSPDAVDSLRPGDGIDHRREAGSLALDLGIAAD